MSKATSPNKSSTPWIKIVGTTILIIFTISLITCVLTGKFNKGTEKDTSDTNDIKIESLGNLTDASNSELSEESQTSKQTQHAVPETDANASTSKAELDLLGFLTTRANEWSSENKPTLKGSTYTDIFDTTIDSSTKSVTFKGALVTATNKKGNYAITLKDTCEGNSQHSILNEGYAEKNRDTIIEDLSDVISDPDLTFTMQANVNIIDFTDLDKGAIAANIIRNQNIDSDAAANLQDESVYSNAKYSLFANSAKQYNSDGKIIRSYILHTYTNQYVYESLIEIGSDTDLGTTGSNNKIRDILQGKSTFKTTKVVKTDIYDQALNYVSSAANKQIEEEIDIYSK